MEESDVIAGGLEHTVEGGADQFATTDESNFVAGEFNIITSEKPKDGGGGSGIVMRMEAKAVNVF